MHLKQRIIQVQTRAILNLPQKTHILLKSLAKQRGTTMVDTVDQLLARAIAEGEIAGPVPGLELAESRAGRITIGNLAECEPYLARDFASNLDGILEPGRHNYVMASIANTGMLTVRRVPRGVLIEHTAKDRPTITVTVGEAMARRLASQVRKAADELDAEVIIDEF